MKVLNNLHPRYLFYILFFSFPFLTTYFSLIDRVAFHWLGLSLFNLTLFLYIVYQKKLDLLYKIFKHPIIIYFSIFLFFCLISFFFSYNLIESIINLSQFIVFISSIILLSALHFNSNIIFAIISLIICFIIQMSFTLNGYYSIVALTNYEFGFASFLNGITANKNITAALFLMSAPFLLFLYNYKKSFFLNSLIYLTLFFCFFSIFILSARSALIGLFLSSVIYFIFSIYISKNKSPLFFIKKLSVWFLPLIFSYIFFNFSTFNSSNINVVNRISSIDISDKSTQLRLNYYKYSLDYIFSHPFKPLGLGNWKISSIDWDKNNISGLTVPYHAHNDFLQLGTEIGALGLISYLCFFFSCFYYAFKLIISDKLNKYLYISIIMSWSVFFVDSLFNFPNSRVIQLIILAFSISLIVHKSIISSSYVTEK